LGGRHLVVAILENDLPYRRLGLTVSSRVGNAVARNRVKRWLREIFRHHRNALPPGVDVVLIARPGSPELGHRRLEAELVTLAGRLRAGEGTRGRSKARRSPGRSG
jgi:ribonuclease P protein component